MKTIPRTERQRCAFTLTELLVVIGTIAVLTATLLPMVAKAKQDAQRVVCEENMHAIWQGVRQYANTFDNHFPCPPPARLVELGNYGWGGEPWSDWWIDTYLKPGVENFLGTRTTSLARCPTMGRSGTTEWPRWMDSRNPNFSYAFNAYVCGGFDDWKNPSTGLVERTLCQGASVADPDLQSHAARAMLLTETCCGSRIGRNDHVNGAHYSRGLIPGSVPQPESHYGGQHDGRANVLFCDGHVESLSISDIPIMDVHDARGSSNPDSQVFWHNTMWPRVFSD